MRLDPYLRQLGWATLVANCVLVVTGGAVRLTGSGLGCPTWPHCTDEGDFTPRHAVSVHSLIEFGNRTLTFVLAAIAVATFVAAWQSGRRDLRLIALLIGLGIPAQAVIGGITVLTDLNPWIVSLHLVSSLVIIALSVLFLRRLDGPTPAYVGGPLSMLATLNSAAGWVVLYIGTVVTGSGPHAGDAKAPRNGLDPLQVSQAHADVVFLFVGLTVALVVVLPVAGVPGEAARAARVLLGLEVAQGALGFVQYFTDLPAVLVGLHMLGAALIAAAMTWLLLAVRERTPASPPSERPVVPASLRSE